MARLIVDSGPDEMAFPLGTEVTTLGRSASNTIQLRDGHVSRHHAEIVHRDNAYWVRDLRSRNGTFVQGVRLTSEHMLHHSEQLRIGRTVLIFSEEQEDSVSTGEKPPETFAVYLPDEMIGEVKVSIHNEAIFDEEMRGNHVKSLLWAIESIHSVTQPDRILPEILGITFEVFRPQFVVIPTLDPVTGVVVPRLVNTGDYDKEIVISKPLVLQSIRDSTGMLLTHSESGQGSKADRDAQASLIHTALCAPLIARGTPPGVIWVEALRYEVCYNEGDLRLLMAIANHAALTISKSSSS